MVLIPVLYIFLVVGFFLCVVDDIIEQKCENKISNISIFSMFYLILSIPFYCFYNVVYDSIYLFMNILSFILFIVALAIHDCEEPAVVFYGIFIMIITFLICTGIIISKISKISNNDRNYLGNYLEEFNEEL